MFLMRLIVGITGASGAIFGVRILEALKHLQVETHLVMSNWARTTLVHETDYSLPYVESLASVVHHPENQAAPISSGSFRTDGMIIVPCSMKSLAAIRCGFGSNLLHRAADVVLKERRKLVLVTRESPFSEIHLENMLFLSRMGAVIFPPVPAFYSKPETIEQIVNHIAARVLDQFDLDMRGITRWQGFTASKENGEPPSKIPPKA